MELSLTGKAGHGTPDELASMSAVIIDGDKIFIDNAAIHGKSRVERGIAFTAKSAASVPGRHVHVIWVTLKKNEEGSAYYGLAASTLVIHDGEKIGYKSVPDQVNKMGAAMKGAVQLEFLSSEEKQRLAKFLHELREDLWQNTPESIKNQLV